MDTKEPQHPAHGHVQISRVTGTRTLHGSPINALSYVQVTVALEKSWTSEGFRCGYGDRSPSGTIVEFCMSETQFAQAITTLSSGAGTPCTLSRYCPGDSIDIEEPESRDSETDLMYERFHQEFAQRNEAMAKLCSEAEGMLKAAKVSGKNQQPILGQLRAIRMLLENNSKFWAQSFEEYVHKTVQVAKTEVAAFAANVAHETGVEALKSGVTMKIIGESCEES